MANASNEVETNHDIAEKIEKNVYKLTRREGRSNVWRIFGEIEKPDGTIIPKTLCCRVCGVVMKFSGKQTSNLCRHKCYLKSQKNAPNQKIRVKKFKRKEKRVEIAEVVQPPSQADTDKQLFSTLCDIDVNNYLYLFERCKEFNIVARQIKYLEKDHIWELIPKTNLGVLAEFEYLLNEWKTKNAFIKTKTATSSDNIRRTKATPIPATVKNKPSAATAPMTAPSIVQTAGPSTSTATIMKSIVLPGTSASFIDDEDMGTEFISSPMKYDDDSHSTIMSSSHPSIDSGDVHGSAKYSLSHIIPKVLKQCQQKYHVNGQLTEVERRLLSASIIDYFVVRNIHLPVSRFEFLAEQIEEHFPTESKNEWYDGNGKNCKRRGRLYLKHYNINRRKSSGKKRKREQSMESVDSPFVEHEDSMDEEPDEESEQIQKWLKCNKCEDMNEVISMWQSSQNYRKRQLRNIEPNSKESVDRILNDWPSYKWTNGHLLIYNDFYHMYPESEAMMRERWPIFIQKIGNLMESKLEDNASVELLIQFNTLSPGDMNEDSKEATLFKLMHAVTKPSKMVYTAQGTRRYTIADSQHSVMRLITHPSEMETFAEKTPCIFLLGDSFLNVEQCFVAFGDIRYELKFMDALCVCFQLYIIFKIDFPLASLNFWKFVRGYIFDIHSEHESSYAVMDNIVKYLATYNAATT